MLNNLNCYMFNVRISPVRLCGQAVSRETRLVKVITSKASVSRETACLKGVEFNSTPFPSEVQLIDFQVIQQV